MGGNIYPHSPKHCPFCIRQFGSFLKTLMDDNKKKATSGAPAVDTRIKALVLPNIHVDSSNPTFPIWSDFMSLDSNGGEDSGRRELLREAVERGCPKLQHIECSWFADDDDVEVAINALTEGCKTWGLKSFYAMYLNDLDYYHRSRSILETLLMHHSGTLEEIELKECEIVVSDDLMFLFSNCKNLKRVKIEPSDSGEAVICFNEVVSEWVCRDLKELHLVLSRPRILSLYEPTEWLETQVRRMGKSVYGQIGRLVRLEILSLAFDEGEYPNAQTKEFEYDLTRERGWLAELAGLKELRHFDAATDFWSRMGQGEVEFMDAQWPKLEKMTFKVFSLEIIMKEPHWQWLQKRRPNLKFSAY
ncbi:hypothetical protein BGZ65_003940 [Modicella reniformis]|uniref:Uncharacterized protein n=1 Tax=Modicella reniformis TaxID=1440133 RepID=A0A9P6M939_9FUNG|nr:hypothetical protein BGZ65_003940 [Modicella reniformis]